jgi:Dolichyl-phosphate-mannose-protein mannosyltransferase
MSSENLGRGWALGAAFCLILVFAAQMVNAVWQQSLTWDEDDHIFAGYMSWKTADFGFNPEHPPLIKAIATLPLLPLDLRLPALQLGFFKNATYIEGRELLFRNGPQYPVDTLVFRVRMAAMSSALLLALLVFFAAREMFGDEAGLLALLLLVFEPNIVAHGAYVTTDTGVACFLLAAVYAFYRYVTAPSGTRLVIAGVAAGLALASKHSAVLLLPILILLAAGAVALRSGWKYSEESRGVMAAKLLLALAVICVVAIGVLWACYGFRYDARPAGLALNPSLADYTKPLRPFEAHGILWFARWHLLPESYLYGLTDVRSMANGMPAYIFGKVYAHGVWYYFPAVFLIKSTLGFLGLFAVSLYALAARKVEGGLEILFLTVPPVFYFAIAMGSSLNIGARHILPVYVFLCVLLAGAAVGLMRAGRAWRYVIAALVIGHVASALWVYPNSIAYANELWGGPSQTHRYLSDSNTDWGQQLKAVKKYVDAHGIKNCWFAYFVQPAVQFEDYGIPCKPLPTPDTGFFDVAYDVPRHIEGPVLISAGTLTGFELGSDVLNPYREFEKLQPVANIQDGVLVFEGSFDVPLASAMSHVIRSGDLLTLKKMQEALAEAQTAVRIAPDALQTQMALGDALAAVNRSGDAEVAYQKALGIVHTMEPSAQEVWVPLIEAKLKGK